MNHPLIIPTIIFRHENYPYIKPYTKPGNLNLLCSYPLYVIHDYIEPIMISHIDLNTLTIWEQKTTETRKVLHEKKIGKKWNATNSSCQKLWVWAYWV